MAEFEMQDFISKINLGQIGTGTLEGAITGISVLEDEDGKGNFKENTVIRSDRNLQIKVSWELFGTKLDKPHVDVLNIPGSWMVTAYLEGWGKNAEDYDLKGGVVSVMGNKTDGKTNITGHAGESAWQYSDVININPKTTLTPTVQGASIAGPYKLAVTVTYENPPGTPGPMAGFVELPHMIQIYDPS